MQLCLQISAVVALLKSQVLSKVFIQSQFIGLGRMEGLRVGYLTSYNSFSSKRTLPNLLMMVTQANSVLSFDEFY